MKTLDLSGIWTCETPDGSVRKEVTLPGSSSENGIGKKQEYFDEPCKEAYRAPRERYEYIGKLIYKRTIDIPEGFEGMDLSLFFERINIASKLYFDGIPVGRGIVALSTPHIYRLSDRVDEQGKPLFQKLTGRHEITLVIDNSDVLHIGNMASGYSVDTQGYWNGCIGRMELVAVSCCHIESVNVFPEKGHLRIATVTISDRHVPMEIKKAELKYSFVSPTGKKAEGTQEIELFSKRQRNWFSLEIPELSKDDLWNEFNPALCSLTVKLDGDPYETTFGIRQVAVKDKQFMINDRPMSLRGTINCAQYPVTGYPPMDASTWEKHFKILKDWGLNHVRFHAWCPPEAAFQAADRLGIYLAVEMPLWLNRDVTPMELGDDECQQIYFRDEALKISEFYGNHPSFVLFSNGNENLGDYAFLETVIAEMKVHDPRRLYTMSSNFDHPMSPYEDYLCAFEILHNKARIQFLHDEVAENTCVDYDDMREKVPAPFTSFEVGQYCVYPDVDICESYTGAMLPVNFDVIRKDMKKHGVYGRLKDYIKASGDLAAKLYKEDIEAVLRTEGMGGFQLLSLTDYTGQSTATVGMLDVMFNDKGVIDPKEWRMFCSEVVPLFLAKRVFTTGEHIIGALSLYDAGKEPIKNVTYNLSVTDGKTGEKLYSKEYVKTGRKTEVDIPLDFIKQNSLLKVYVSVEGNGKTYTNSWRIFVYKDCCSPDIPGDKVIKSKVDYEKAAKKGGRYLITRDLYTTEELVKNSFIPVFWSPVHFPSEAPVGFMIDSENGVLGKFPTERYADYQWKKLIDDSVSLRLKDVGRDVHPIVECVPNFADNEPKSPLFTFTEGKAEFIFSGFDLSGEDVTTKALKASIAEYII